MSKFVDLSQDIIDNMAVHPYDDKVKLYQDKYLEEDKYNNWFWQTKNTEVFFE